MMKLIISILFISLVVSQEKYAADFLNIDYGAKTLASGNTFFMGNGDLSSVKWFPADYSFNNKRKVYGTFISKFDGLLEQFHIGYSQPLLGGYNITVNLNYSGVTDIPSYGKLVLETDKTPVQEQPSSFFDNQNYILSTTFSKLFDEEIDLGWDYFKLPIKIPIALNVNYLYSSLYELNANAFVLDLSFGFQFNLGTLLKSKGLGDISFYTNIVNFAGSKLSWDTVEGENGATTEHFEKISSNTIWGVTFTQPANDINLDFGIGFQYQSLYSDFGYGIVLTYDKQIEFRFGLDNNDITFGLGLEYNNIDLFASMKPSHDLGKSMNLDVVYGF